MSERRDYYRQVEQRSGVSRKLHRDARDRKIVGVCSGIARYYGIEPWVVRLIAVTGLLFFPSIVFPAYWIAYFVMGTPQPDNREQAVPSQQSGGHGRRDHRSPAPELGPRLSPRYSLRNVQADLTEVELRLRRMESHVTSSQYELQRELNKIDSPRSRRS
jgi:phage shock protein C